MKNYINMIREINLNNITDDKLEFTLLKLGLNDEVLEEFPNTFHEFTNKGVKSWQYPNQFSKLLKILNNYKFNSYLEIGCRWGGTFIIITEILKKKNKEIKSFACDIIEESNILKEYRNYNEFKYIKCKSSELNKNNVQEQIDLIFIDGDHKYESIKLDYYNSLTFKPKIIIVHDIVNESVPDVIKFWNEVKNNYKYIEITDQYEEFNKKYLGLGILFIEKNPD